MDPAVWEGNEVNGLERRLRQVEGVADLTIELGDAGLEGIRVKINEGSDESEVMEGIRRILVAYGLRSRSQTNEVGIPDLGNEPSVNGDSALPEASPNVRPSEQGLIVEVGSGTHTVSEVGERSPVGVADAMVRAVAKWKGVEPPSRIALALDELDGERVITLLARRRDRLAVSAAVCLPKLADGLYRASVDVLSGLEEPVSAS
jgi:hypothetical protein